ncbi:hypothetical protein [Spirosoma endbachense]|nr:hypothetical protein [Spirosoma endbachense]
MIHSSTFTRFKWCMIIGWTGLLLYAVGWFLAEYNRIIPGGINY